MALISRDYWEWLAYPPPYTDKQLAGQAARRRMAIDARLKLCRKLRMKQGTPLEMLLDKAEEELGIWERNELEAEL